MRELLQQMEENTEKTATASFAFSEEQNGEMLAEWSVVENKLNSGNSRQLDGFIVARLPELDSNTVKLEPKETLEEALTGTLKGTEQDTPRFGYFQKISGMIFEPCRIVFSGTSSFIGSRFQSPKYAAETEAAGSTSKKNFYTVLINTGVVLLICGGILLFTGKNKEKTENDNTPEKSVAALESLLEKPAEKNTEESKIIPAPAVAASDKQKAEAKKTAEDAAKAKAAAELAAKAKAAPAVAASDKQKAEAEAKKTAEDAAKAKAALAANQKAEEEAKKRLAENSPWERPATDNYSPWIMNPADRSAEDNTTVNNVVNTAANTAVNIPAISTQPIPSAAIPNPAVANRAVPNPVNPYPSYSAQQPVSSGYAKTSRYTQYPAQPAEQYNGQYNGQYPMPQTSSPYQQQYNAGQYGQHGWSAHQQLGSNGAPAGAIPMRENPASYQTQYNQYSQYAAAQSAPQNPVYMANRPQTVPQQTAPQIPQGQPVVVPQYGTPMPVQGTAPVQNPVQYQTQPYQTTPYQAPYQGQPYYYPSAAPAPVR